MKRTARTETEIWSDFYRLVSGSELARSVSGGIYFAEAKNGVLRSLRPSGSRKEDIELLVDAMTSVQFQYGLVNIKIFVPDIDPEANGVYVPDLRRLSEIEGIAADFLDSLTVAGTPYRFVRSTPVASFPEPDRNEHFVSVMFNYRYFGELPPEAVGE